MTAWRGGRRNCCRSWLRLNFASTSWIHCARGESSLGRPLARRSVSGRVLLLNIGGTLSAPPGRLSRGAAPRRRGPVCSRHCCCSGSCGRGFFMARPPWGREVPAPRHLSTAADRAAARAAARAATDRAADRSGRPVPPPGSPVTAAGSPFLMGPRACWPACPRSRAGVGLRPRRLPPRRRPWCTRFSLPYPSRRLLLPGRLRLGQLP